MIPDAIRYPIKWRLEALRDELRPRWRGTIRYHGPSLNGTGRVGFHTYSLITRTREPREALTRAHEALLEHLQDAAPECLAIHIDTRYAIPVSAVSQAYGWWLRSRARMWLQVARQLLRVQANIARALRAAAKVHR